MASGSSSSMIVSPTVNYDVFLSFRGEDTRHNFTDHLYAALNNAGISTFRDDEEISRGDELKPEIEKAIKASKGSIVVLSENYATSTWCLDELWLILEQRREFNHFVLPIFYHVDPSDIRKQDKTFKIEVKTSSKWTDDNVKRWREALKQVVDLKGEQVLGSEVNFLEKIVDDIYNNKVVRKLVDIPRHLTGMIARYEDINSWLENPDIKVFVISGMAGSGKTTLANYIVSLNSQHFERISIVKVMGGVGTEDNRHELLRKFVADLLGEVKGKWLHNMIDRALKMKKALIVFDNIGEPSELDHFLGTGDINKASKIIITTRRNIAHNWLESRSWSCQEYNMQLLNDDESLELLSLHAFGIKTPREGYKEHAKEVLQYCEGNPLALEVLGSSLSEDISIQHWKSTLHELEKDMDDRIQSILITSYNSLPNNLNRELFLHIACFFVGKDKDYVEQILEDDCCAPSGIKVLTNRCLLSVSPNNKLMMHQLIQEMGKNIIRTESKRLKKRSRVWDSRDSYKILRERKGSKTMEGLALDMNDLQLSTSSDILSTDSLRKMDNLKLLRLKDVDLTGNYKSFSEVLRWLCWHQSHFPAIPSGLLQGSLVAIDMSNSNLEVFEPPIVLQSLKILNLQCSKSLSKIQNISRLPNLETLILCDCIELVHGCESIGGLMNLALLNMERCISLPWSIDGIIKSLEDFSSSGGSLQETSFCLPHSLVRLFLSDCWLQCNDYFPLDFNVQPNLQYLDLSGGWFETLPSYNHLKFLRVLELSRCSRLKWLLRLPSALVELYVYGCVVLEKITFESHQFTLQEFCYEGCPQLFEIQGFVKLVPIANLVETDLGHMVWLKEYENHEVSLVGDDGLTISRSKQIQMLYEFGIMSTSLPDIKDPNMISKHLSESSSVSFKVPPHPKNRRLKGLDVTFKYTIISGQDYAWFAKIHTNNGVDLMYNPIVFGDPGDGGVGIWLSYWPIGSRLLVGDEVNVSIVVLSGILEVHECGSSLVYANDEINMPREKTRGVDLSAFQLNTGANYLCRRDFFKLMEVGGLTPGWLSILVGDTIDDREVRGWRKTGRPNTSFNQSQTESSHPSLIELPDSSFTESPRLSLTELEDSLFTEWSGPLFPDLPDSSFRERSRPSLTELPDSSLTELPDSSLTESKKF